MSAIEHAGVRGRSLHDIASWMTGNMAGSRCVLLRASRVEMLHTSSMLHGVHLAPVIVAASIAASDNVPQSARQAGPVITFLTFLLLHPCLSRHAIHTGVPLTSNETHASVWRVPRPHMAPRHCRGLASPAVLRQISMYFQGYRQRQTAKQPTHPDNRI